MLPEMLTHNLVDTHWFWNYEQRMATDFEGSQVALYETVAEGPLAEQETLPAPTPKQSWRRI